MTPENEALKSPPNRQRRKSLLWITLGIGILALLWLLLWMFYLRFYESTDDAYVNGNMINVTPVVAGTPIAFFADDTDFVEQGKLLVLLDSTPYKIVYEQELATLTTIALQVNQLYEDVNIKRANVRAKKILFEKAQYDFQNRSALVDSQAISKEDFVHAQDDLLVAEWTLKLAESELKKSLDAIGSEPKQNHPLITTQKAIVRHAYYNLQHCSVFAPATGYVAQRAVEVGQSVNIDTPMMAIIPAEGMWIDANFKETQLTYMRIGQPTRLTIDLYGSDVVFEGKVLGIGMGTGSVFSLIPPQNATGNWIKIVQRLPVRISLKPEQVRKFPLRLGLSADVRVDISQTDLPMLAKTPPTAPVAVTKVFDLSFEEVDILMNEIIEHAFSP